MTVTEMVREFHIAFGLPVRTNALRRFPEDEIDLRFDLISEEFEELGRALANQDPVEVLDALADIVYVTYGAAVQFGLPLDAAIREVHHSNMTKTGGGHREDGKVLKGPGYRPPALSNMVFLAQRGDA